MIVVNAIVFEELRFQNFFRSHDVDGRPKHTEKKCVFSNFSGVAGI